MDWYNSLLFLHAASTLAMAGLIWFVQVVHYPLFAHVDALSFSEFAAQHVRRTGFVVAPLMLIEAATAAWLAIWPPSVEAAVTSYVGFTLLAIVWLSTALLQMPCHRRLENGKDLAIINRLVATNWIRTVAWTGRGVVALQLLVG